MAEGAWPALSLRKARLFAAACCRLLPAAFLSGPAGEAVVAGERFADGELSPEGLARPWQLAPRFALKAAEPTGALACALVAHPRGARPALTAGLVGAYSWGHSGAPPVDTSGELIRAELQALPAGATGVGNWLGRLWGGLTDGMAGHDRARLAQELAARSRADEEAAWLEEGFRWCAEQFSPLLEEIVGVPTRPAQVDRARWTPTIDALAGAAYQERALPAGALDPPRLAVLADALEEAACCDDAILTHLRSSGPHVRGCWALDFVLGKK